MSYVCKKIDCTHIFHQWKSSLTYFKSENLYAFISWVKVLTDPFNEYKSSLIYFMDENLCWHISWENFLFQKPQEISFTYSKNNNSLCTNFMNKNSSEKNVSMMKILTHISMDDNLHSHTPWVEIQYDMSSHSSKASIIPTYSDSQSVKKQNFNKLHHQK